MYDCIQKNYQTNTDSLCGLYRVDAFSVQSAKPKLIELLHTKLTAFSSDGLTNLSLLTLSKITCSFTCSDIKKRLHLSQEEADCLDSLFTSIYIRQINKDSTDVTSKLLHEKLRALSIQIQINIIEKFYFDAFLDTTLIITFSNINYISTQKDASFSPPSTDTLFLVYLDIKPNVNDITNALFPFSEPTHHLREFNVVELKLKPSYFLSSSSLSSALELGSLEYYSSSSLTLLIKYVINEICFLLTTYSLQQVQELYHYPQEIMTLLSSYSSITHDIKCSLYNRIFNLSTPSLKLLCLQFLQRYLAVLPIKQ